jgi:hypothetical protein
MKLYQGLSCIFLLLAGCDTKTSDADNAQTKAYADWQDWHDKKREVEARVDDLAEAPGGVDYPAIIEVYQKSGWPADIVNLRIGAEIIGSYEDSRPARRPQQSMSQGFDLMEKAALSTGEGRTATPQKLRLWFERGVGKAPNYVMAPIPEIAACWMKVEKDSYDDKIDDPAQVTACIALRKKLMPEK